MAESLDDGMFWLPPQFLADDVVVGKNSKKNGYDGLGLESDYNKSLFPVEFPYGFGSFPFSSDLSSPVESVVGSTGTESDEEDYLSGLTRQMARATLEYDFKRNDFTCGPEITKVLCYIVQFTLLWVNPKFLLHLIGVHLPGSGCFRVTSINALCCWEWVQMQTGFKR
ncbi:hypothetical protein HS088_TW03G01233 [Tripterygium wilfordii]|uniref:Uncharacterized protein n=1 Tax=Tripterygium wilfordii TaxID=458696 RepID=A0A7J7DX71_TRIWF|nr:hypothetical protein HS088_TW03G01233 [Tripterygium wilfordii]